VWFDAANLPLIRSLDANFFEPADSGSNAFWNVDAGEEAAWSSQGLIAGGEQPQQAHSPKYHYPGVDVRRMLAAIKPERDGARTIRYINPVTGGPVMPALDCAAMRLAKARSTRAKRVTYNSVCLVVSGTGRSTIGEHIFDWGEGDVFTIPHWTWAKHEAFDGEADLFMVTDRVVYEQLGLLRAELQ
jgi:gentisate 1,2-dioxygenase